MARRLVCSRVETEVEHEGSGIFRSIDIGGTIGVWNIISEELRSESHENIDTLSLHLESINGVSANWVDESLGLLLRVEGLVFDGVGVEGNSIINHDVTTSAGVNRHDVISQEGKSMPVTVLVGISV